MRNDRGAIADDCGVKEYLTSSLNELAKSAKYLFVAFFLPIIPTPNQQMNTI
jgi:hypothetical protein